MTLIAALDLQGYPILLGDLLISQTGEARDHADIPTIVDVNSVLPTEWLRSIVGLNRKLTIINERFAVGWAGRKFAAVSIFKELRVRFESRLIEREELLVFLDEQKDPNVCKVSLVGWLVDSRGPFAFLWDSKTGRGANKSLYVEGTGKANFLSDFQSREVESISSDNPLADAVSEALTLAGNVVGRKVMSGQNLLELYGGGIELIYYSANGFRELNNVAYLHWQFDIEHDSPLMMNPVLRYVYKKDLLVIEETRYERGSPKKRFHPVLPVDRHTFQERMPDGVVSPADFYCNFVYVPVEGYGHIISTVVLAKNNGMIEFEVRQDGDSISQDLHVDGSFGPYLKNLFGARRSALKASDQWVHNG